MTALWIGLAVLVVLVLVALLTWRLRRAAGVLDQIMRDELSDPNAPPVPDPDPEVHEAESRNQ